MANLNKSWNQQYRLTPIASAVALIIMGYGVPAQAQQATAAAAGADVKSMQLETVVVSANRRIEKLGDVPQSITVVSEADMARNNVRELVDLINLAPALSISIGTQVGTNSINMRGIGTTSNNLGIEGDVAFIVDDLPYAQPQQAFKDLADAARIEVLKGPQSTMFGKSAIAGAVVVTTKPIGSGPMKANVKLFTTSDQEFRVSGSLSGRFSDSVGMRLYASKTNFPGLLNNLTDGSKMNGSGSKSVLAKIEWRITPDLDMLLSPYFDDSVVTGNAVAMTSIQPGVGYFANKAYTALSNTAILRGITVSPFNRDIRLDSPTGLDSTNRGVGLRFNYQFSDNSPLSGHALTSISSINNYKSYDYRDNDSIDLISTFYMVNAAGKPSGISAKQEINGHADTKTATQEIRLTSPETAAFNYVAGLWLAKNSLDRDYYRGNPFVKETNFTNYLTTSSNLNRAIYANANWKLNQQHGFTAGVRVNRESNNYSFHTIDSLSSSAASNVHTGELLYVAPQHDENAVTGKLGYTYHVTPNIMVYTTASTGHKGVAYDMTSGANNPRVFARLPLAAEKANSFEAGLKANLWNNRATLNAAIYDTEFKNYQTSSTERFSDGSSASILYSIPALQTRGFEADGKVLVSKDLLLSASLAFTRATILNWPQAPCFTGSTDCTVPNVLVPGAFVRNGNGGAMPNAPKWKMSFGGEYTLPAFSSYKTAINFQTRAQSSVKGNISQDPTRDRPGYGIVDLGASLSDSKGMVKLTVGVKNVGDKHYAAGQTGGFLSFRPTTGSTITSTGWTPARDAFRYFTVGLEINY